MLCYISHSWRRREKRGTVIFRHHLIYPATSIHISYISELRPRVVKWVENVSESPGDMNCICGTLKCAHFSLCNRVTVRKQYIVTHQRNNHVFTIVFIKEEKQIHFRKIVNVQQEFKVIKTYC